jgi:signal transduction histidine kinase
MSILAFLPLFIVGLLYILIDYRKESNWWMGLIWIFGSAFGLRHVIQPFVHGTLSAKMLLGALSFFSLTFVYPYLMWNLSLNNDYRNLHPAKRISLTILFGLPLVAMAVIFGFQKFYFYSLHIDLALSLAIWAVLYIILGNIILVRNYLKETNPKIKKERLTSCILLLPFTLLIALFSYILEIFGYPNAFFYELYILPVFLIFYFILAIKYGFFGIKIEFKTYSLDDTMKVMSVGTSFINHALKNKISLIDIALKCMKDDIVTKEQGIEVIEKSINHMMNIVIRVNEKTQEIELVPEYINLKEIIINTIKTLEPLYQKNHIQLEFQHNTEGFIVGDRTHIQEVLNNIVKNAIEVLPEKGEILIKLYCNNKSIFIEIKDNGAGIPKIHLSHIMEPFYSTKNGPDNFGLGLSYSYQVMKKHRGAIEIYSRENQGTTVLLSFPQN